MIRANLAGATLVRADLANAHLARANLAFASLDGANFAGAQLARATLAGASLDGADFGFGLVQNYWTLTRIGSDCAELEVAYTPKGQVCIRRACSGWLTPDEFLARVETAHGETLHGKVYRSALEYIQARVAMELAEAQKS